MARLYADEDVSRQVVRLLEPSHDVLDPLKQGEAGHSDAWHLRAASLDQRILLTVNLHDYRFLHRVLVTYGVFSDSESHAGILSVVGTPDPQAWTNAIETLIGEESNLAGRLLVWHGELQGWREDAWRLDE